MPSDDQPEPVKLAPLKQFVRDHSDKRVGGDAANLLRAQSNEIIRLISMRAGVYAENRDKKTVQEEDIQRAYDDLLEPHDVLLDAADQLDSTSERMKEYADQSPINAEIE